MSDHWTLAQTGFTVDTSVIQLTLNMEFLLLNWDFLLYLWYYCFSKMIATVRCHIHLSTNELDHDTLVGTGFTAI